MKRFFLLAALSCTAAVLAIVSSTSVTADDQAAEPEFKVMKVEIGKDLVDKITKAAPEKATVKPKTKRMLLACTRSVGFQHDTIPICAKMLEIMGNKTGAWETVISNDLKVFEPENLKDFDGVFFCVTTGSIFGDGQLDKMGKEGERYARLRKSLLDFVAGGKGVGGNHGATDANYHWPEYGKMMGAYFSEHPYGRIVVKIDDPDSPVNAAFKGKGFPIQDEMYVFGPKPPLALEQPYSRAKLHVLLSIDVEASKLPNKGPCADQDYAISWIKPYEDGRVFYCSFGHDRQIYTNPMILQHFQDGVQYLLGDLEADDLPIAKPKADAPKEAPKSTPLQPGQPGGVSPRNPPAVGKRILASEFPQTASRVMFFEARINSKDSSIRARVLTELGYFYWLPDSEYVGFLKRMYKDPDPLVRSSANKILYDMWVPQDPDVLGLLRVKEAIPALIKLADDPNISVRYTAARALLDCGDRSSASAIFDEMSATQLALYASGTTTEHEGKLSRRSEVSPYYAACACRGLIEVGGNDKRKGLKRLIELLGFLERSKDVNDQSNTHWVRGTLAAVSGEYFTSSEEASKWLTQHAETKSAVPTPATPKIVQINLPNALVDKITKAAPEKATAKPAAKRKLLAFTRSVAFRHDSIPVCAKTLEVMGNKTGAWETVITDDLNAFEPENLKQFDGVFFCVTSGEIFGNGNPDKMMSEEAPKYARLRKSLLDFVASSKGVGGNHSATDTCYTWPEYGQMMGAYFSGHPWGKVVVKIDDPDSPLNAAFNGKGFPISDEMYVFGPRQQTGQPYSREKQHVLLSIDVEASKLPTKGFRPDQDYAISWIKPYGDGRVFYCSFGHVTDIYTNPTILRHFQDGVQYLLGDLKADDSPSAPPGQDSRTDTLPKK